MFRTTLAATAIALLSTAGTAAAATPFTAGTGSDPDVAVTPNGTAFVAYNVDSPHRINVCRVARDTDTCAATTTLSFPSGGSAQEAGEPQVFAVSDTKIVVTASCWQCGAGGATDRLYKFVSTDGGASFAAGVEIGRPDSGSTAFPDGNSQADWREDLDGGTLISARSGRVGVYNTALNTEMVTFASGIQYRPAVARVPGTGRAVAVASDLGIIRFGYSTSALANPTRAQLINAANWTTGQQLSASGITAQEPSLASGPSGLFVGYQRLLPDQFLVQKFDPATNTFGPAIAIQGSSAIDSSIGYPYLYQDPSGRLHGIWRALTDPRRLRYTVSTDGGASFSAARSLVSGETVLDPQMAAASDGYGVVAYETVGGSTVRVVRLDPFVDDGSTGTTPPGTTTTPTPGTTTTDPLVVGYPGPRYPGPNRTVTATVPGAELGLDVPKGCVRPGQKFKVTLRFKKQRRKGNLFVKVRRVDFSEGTKLKLRDRKAPFTYTFKVQASKKPGSTVTVRARAFIKVKRGKGPKKSIKTTVKVCG